MENIYLYQINNISYGYDEERETSIIKSDEFELSLSQASSGYQSIVPLYVVSQFLTQNLNDSKQLEGGSLNVKQTVRRNQEIANLMSVDNLTANEKEERVKQINRKYLNTCFVNVVEEPEQNLYPTSQQAILELPNWFQ